MIGIYWIAKFWLKTEMPFTQNTFGGMWSFCVCCRFLSTVAIDIMSAEFSFYYKNYGSTYHQFHYI